VRPRLFRDDHPSGQLARPAPPGSPVSTADWETTRKRQILATAVKDAQGRTSDFERYIVTIDGFWLNAGDQMAVQSRSIVPIRELLIEGHRRGHASSSPVRSRRRSAGMTDRQPSQLAQSRCLQESTMPQRRHRPASGSGSS
jgi:hypothetical protein